MDVIMVATAGSVDNGKSTLIGRLLHDTQSILDDQMVAVAEASRRYGYGHVNLALLTDGLRAEREQGITIDVAYRYFATDRRSFILADTPGHERYTRNMVTGTADADIAVVLVDATRGVTDQTRRHMAVAAMVDVGVIVVAVNKMDLVGWDEGVYLKIVDTADRFLWSFDNTPAVMPIPMSALNGDNVVDRSVSSDWHTGPTLLEFLDQFVVERPCPGARLDVQWVIRHGKGRSYTGRLSGGCLAVGDRVFVFPSGEQSTVTALRHAGRPAEVAKPGQAISVEIFDDLDISRGDTLAAAPLTSVTTIAGAVCCFDGPMRRGSRWSFKHGSRTGMATIEAIERFDMDGGREIVDELNVNDLGEVTVAVHPPIAAQPYRVHREAGRMVLVNEQTNAVAAAVMLA
jgi:sulfate adenylyltransferase subunit 1